MYVIVLLNKRFGVKIDPEYAMTGSSTLVKKGGIELVNMAPWRSAPMADENLVALAGSTS